MESSNPEYLTAEELRNRLYHSLRNRGLVDSIKSQLRNSLVTELQTSFRGHLSLRDLRVPDEGSLLHRAANSLIADHLRHCQYDYTLSVFLPESGLSQDKIFGTQDMLQLLNIIPKSKLHEKLSKFASTQGGKGFLWMFLSEMSALHANSTQDFSVQTDLIKVGPITSLDEKLHSLDEFYSSKRGEHYKTGSAAVEDRLLSFQRQLEDRYNSELKRELARMKDNEIARIRLEEKETSRKDLEQMRKELERTYQLKYDGLVERERNSIERLQREQDIHEKEIYAQRQTILEEIECVRQRETEVKRERETCTREKKLQDERIRDKESDLRRRELEIKRNEAEFEQRLQNQMAQFKLDTQARFIERTQNLEVRESTVKANETIVSEEKSKIQTIKDELRDKTHRVNELETMLQETRHTEVSATRHNEYLNAKLRDMSDYKTMKEQSAMQRNELETLRTRLSEVLTMNERERGRQEELLRELRRPTPETLMMQRDLERARENLRQEQVVFEQQKQQLETRLKEEIDRNRELIRVYEEQTLQMKEMNRENVDLRQHMAMQQQALTNELYRKPHGPEDGRSLNVSHISAQANQEQLIRDDLERELRLSSSRQHRPRFENKEIYNDVEFDLDFGVPGKYNEFTEDDVSSAASADVVAEARYRLKSLEKEANNLDRAYQDFHYNMTNIASVPDGAPSALRGQVSSNQGPRENSASRQGINVRSPTQSPIPSHRPLSSTPYQHASKKSQSADYDDDSFEELSGGRDRPKSSEKIVPHFDISNMSDDRGETSHINADERRIKSRPITISDLEARPGSPSIVVVAGSGSSGGHSPEMLAEIGTRISSEESQPEPTKPTPVSGTLPPLSLDSAWKTPAVSLESAWKGQKEKNAKTKEEEEEEHRKWEEERQKRDAERRRIEEEAWEKEQKELEQLEGKTSAKDTEKESEPPGEQKEENDEGIDPVMKQYMAMVQQQKEKEKEKGTQIAKHTVQVWSKGHMDHTPTQSENDISIADEIKSNTGSDDGFEW